MNEVKNNWIKYYTPPNRGHWQGRVDSYVPERYHQVIKFIDLSEELIPEDDNYSFVIVGFACDEGVARNLGRIGAAQGPDKLRDYLANLPFNYANYINVYDIGNIDCTDKNLEAAQKALGFVVEKILLAGCHPIVLGGGHETAWGHYQGIANTDYSQDLGIINFDAHFDLRPMLNGNLGSSGTPFTQIALDRETENLDFNYFCIGIQPTANTLSLYEQAQELDVKFIEAQELINPSSNSHLEEFSDFLQDQDSIYLSICLDVFSSCTAPGVSAPQPLGVMPQHILPYLRLLAASGKVITIDLVELAPNLDKDNNTARLGAHLLADYINTACMTDE